VRDLPRPRGPGHAAELPANFSDPSALLQHRFNTPDDTGWHRMTS
jgi:hypothetical protein